jgi:rhodanese-related sulfurtransferase
MSNNPLQKDILDLFEQSRQEISTFIAEMDTSEKEATGRPDQWSAKDTLANIAFWQTYMVERMEFYRHEKNPPREVDFDKLSADAYAASQSRSWDKVLADGNTALNNLIEAVSHFSAAQLSANNAYGDSPGGPLWGEIIANGYLVAMKSFQQFYANRNNIMQANALKEQESQQNMRFNRYRPVIHLIDLDTLHDQQSDLLPFVIDVRRSEEYQAGHISGAINIPLNQLADHITKIPNNQAIVTYCNMHHPGESRGEQASILLRERGYNATALNGGFPAWKAAGLPIETEASV